MDIKKAVEVLVAKAVVVSSAAERAIAIGIIKSCKEKREAVVAFFKDSKQKAHETWKAIVANEKSFTDKLDVYEKSARQAIGVFDDNLERVRVAEEARVKAAAEVEAKKNRRALEFAAAHTKDVDKKAELLDQAAAVQADFISVPSKVEKQAGESSRKTWKYRIIDINAVPRPYLMENDAMLKALATSQKEKAKVDGIKFYYETSLSIKA
jgi:DNA repair photolyase